MNVFLFLHIAWAMGFENRNPIVMNICFEFKWLSLGQMVLWNVNCSDINKFSGVDWWIAKNYFDCEGINLVRVLFGHSIFTLLCPFPFHLKTNLQLCPVKLQVLKYFLSISKAWSLIAFLHSMLCTYQCQARGGGVGHRVGILTFSEKNYQNPHPRAKNNCQKYQNPPPWGKGRRSYTLQSLLHTRGKQ